MGDYQADGGYVQSNGQQHDVGQMPAGYSHQEQNYAAVGVGGEEQVYTPHVDAGGGVLGPPGNQVQGPPVYNTARPSSGPPPGMGGSTFVPGKIFIGGLSNTTTKESLEAYCRQWGDMSDIVLMEGRGFGFVTYTEPQCAQAFLEKKDHQLDDKHIEAKAAVPKNAGGGSGLTRKMFVGGTGDIGEEDFRAHFAQFGDIEDSVILRKPDGTSRGFGFVTYRDESMVEKCLVVPHVIDGKTVEVKRAVKKEDMAAGMGYDQSYAARTGKAPDWHCPECRNKNFGWREVCNRCQAPKPILAGAGMGGAIGAGPMGGMGARGTGGGGAYGGGGSFMGGGNMGMGGGMGGFGGMGGMSPQMNEMGIGMGAMGGYGGGMGGGMAGGMAGNMAGNMGNMGSGMGGGYGGMGRGDGMGGFGGMGGAMSPHMGGGGGHMGAANGGMGNYNTGGYSQPQQGPGYVAAYGDTGSGYDVGGGAATGPGGYSGGGQVGGYGGGAGAGAPYGGGTGAAAPYGGGTGYGGGNGYGGGAGAGGAYGGNTGYANGAGGYQQGGSYGRAAPGRGGMGAQRYRPY